MEDIKEKRLGKLLDATLFRHCETINLIDEFSLCDAMFKYLTESDVDKFFLCPLLLNVSKQEREEVFKVARKYAYLCFYEGNSDYWEDSVMGYTPGVPAELIAEEILDNYNFIVELAYEKGEEAVAELTNFVSEEMATESSIVDYLRHIFNNDQALKVSLDTTSKDNMYKDLSSKAKRVLYKHPRGVLYNEYQEVDEKDFMMLSKDQLFNKMFEVSGDTNILNMNTLEEVVDYLGDKYFESIIREIYLNNTNEDIENIGEKHR